MKPTDQTEKLLRAFCRAEKSRVRTTPEMDQRIIDRALQAHNKTRTTPAAHPRPTIWRTTMKNKITKLTAAAVMLIIITLIFALWPGASLTSKAYAMSDVTDLLQKAKTLHIEGKVFFPKDNSPSSEYVEIPLEYWVDIDNGRMRMHQPGGLKGPNNDEPKYYDTILDGQYKMETSYRKPVHGEWTPLINFTKLTPFQSRLEAHQAANAVIMQMFGNLNQVEGFTEVGEEDIDGIHFDIWQGEVFQGGRGTRIKTWLNPFSGKIGRVLCWHKTQKDEVNWRPLIDLCTIERNIELPLDIFKTDPPEGVELANTKQTAPTAVLGELGSHERSYIGIHVGFTLHDGSVIVGWSTGRVGGSQVDKFRDLKVGGELPELPAKIIGLKPIPNEQNTVYDGYHLASTEKENTLCEWSIYIPNNDTLSRKAFLGYQVLTKYNFDESLFQNKVQALHHDLVIHGPEDFEQWVLGAMADMSDAGLAPAHVTYENVMKLAEELRQSLQQK